MKGKIRKYTCGPPYLRDAGISKHMTVASSPAGPVLTGSLFATYFQSAQAMYPARG